MKLFKQNIFSIKEPTFSKSTNLEKRKIADIIKENYNNIIVKNIYQVGAFEINSSNWKVESDKETFIFKRASIDKLNSLSIQASWMSELQQSSFPTICFLKNNKGELITVDEESAYCISYFENGEYFGSSLYQWSELLKNIQKLFDYSLQYKSIVDLNFPTRTFFTLQENKVIDDLRLLPQIEGISTQQILDIIDEYENLKSAFHSNQENLSHGIFHIDIHPHNLIFRGNTFILLTDFESFQLTIIEISFGFGLYKCLREIIASNSDYFEVSEIAIRLATEFKKTFPKHNLPTLLYLGKIDVMKRLLFIINELLEKGDSKWAFMLDTQLISLEEIDEIISLIE